MNIQTLNNINLIKKALFKKDLTAKELIKKTKIANSTIYRVLSICEKNKILNSLKNNKLNKNKVPTKIYSLINN